MEYSDVINNWKAFAEAISKLEGEVQASLVEEPASEQEICDLEGKFGYSLPPSLREVLQQFSKKVDYRWFLPDSFELEGDLSGIFCGDRHWSLELLTQLDEMKDSCVNELFPNADDPYDVVWHNKLAFHEVPNGDYLAIDLSVAEAEPIVYLSHAGGKGHGVQLAKNFKQFVFDTSRLGCVGGEDWQLMPFIVQGRQYLQPDCNNAVKLRSAFNLKL